MLLIFNLAVGEILYMQLLYFIFYSFDNLHTFVHIIYKKTNYNYIRSARNTNTNKVFHKIKLIFNNALNIQYVMPLIDSQPRN